MSTGFKSEQLVSVPDIPAQVAAVIGGRAEAAFGSISAVVRPEQKGLEFVVDKQAPVFGYGALFRKEDLAFRDAFDKELSELRSSGVMKELLRKYWREAYGNLDASTPSGANSQKTTSPVTSC